MYFYFLKENQPQSHKKSYHDSILKIKMEDQTNTCEVLSQIQDQKSSVLSTGYSHSFSYYRLPYVIILNEFLTYPLLNMLQEAQPVSPMGCFSAWWVCFKSVQSGICIPGLFSQAIFVALSLQKTHHADPPSMVVHISLNLLRQRRDLK